ncbi:MAG: hydroxyethylthiazole kinase [Bifidobacterium sp.]|jgi:hydroxyethylthiazole kinase|nr:hydroxyethylthiazole kinase [Bifidobacterium sp.]MCI1865603.1 hydroxyethylthiazole kinase [Bifidobacterium sp.]
MNDRTSINRHPTGIGDCNPRRDSPPRHGSDDYPPDGRTRALDPSIRPAIIQAVRTVRNTTPLAQSFTNFVTINLVANAQLASGGSAAMSFLPDDIIDLEPAAGASYINVGTLLPFYKDALATIARSFGENGHRWVLDPVAAGIGRTRTEILRSFESWPPTIVRANASEIMALCRIWGITITETGADPTVRRGTRPAGVESVDEVDAAVPYACALAGHLARHAPRGKAAVAVSGASDFVTDGRDGYRLPGGSAMMTKITGAGCSLGGVMATYLAVSDPLVAALAASALYNHASQEAEKASRGPGSFHAAFLDALWNSSPEQVAGTTILPA